MSEQNIHIKYDPQLQNVGLCKKITPSSIHNANYTRCAKINLRNITFQMFNTIMEKYNDTMKYCPHAVSPHPFWTPVDLIGN